MHSLKYSTQAGANIIGAARWCEQGLVGGLTRGAAVPRRRRRGGRRALHALLQIDMVLYNTVYLRGVQ